MCDEYHIVGQEPLIALLNKHGAPYADGYVRKHFSEEKAGELFEMFVGEEGVVRAFVEQLPVQCRYMLADIGGRWGGRTLQHTTLGFFLMMKEKKVRFETKRTKQSICWRSRYSEMIQPQKVGL